MLVELVNVYLSVVEHLMPSDALVATGNLCPGAYLCVALEVVYLSLCKELSKRMVLKV